MEDIPCIRMVFSGATSTLDSSLRVIERGKVKDLEIIISNDEDLNSILGEDLKKYIQSLKL